MDKKVKILLFEDNPGDAGLIEEMLEEFADFQYEFKTVQTLNEGLSLLKKNRLDIILSDLGLPDSYGIDTFLEIHARNSRIPIIILTGMNDEKIGVEAVKKGAQDYLVKGQVDGRLLRRSIQYSIERKKAEERVQNLANIVESSNDAIVTRSLDGFITSWNLGAEQIYGYPAEEVLGKPATVLIPCSLKNEIQKLTEMIKQGEKIHQYETSRLRKDGKVIDVSMTLSPVFDISGELMAISVIARDITESKKAEERLHKSEERYRIVTEQTGQLIYEHDMEENKIYWAGTIEEITGYAQEELLNTGIELWINNVHPEDQKKVWNQKIKGCGQNVKNTENKRNFHLEYRFRRKDGEYIHIEDHGVCLQKGNYLTNKVLGIMKDITERKRTEEALRRSEERFRLALRGSRIVMFSQDLELRYTWVYNPAPGFKIEDVLGRRDYDIYQPEDAEIFTAIKRQVLASGVGRRDEVVTHRPASAGGNMVHDMTTEPLCDSIGTIIGVICVAMDITEKKEAESFLKKIEEARKKEIHHRIKNNLQVISSLLDLQAEKFAGNEIYDTSKVLAAFRDSQNRVISMALIHEELYGSKEVSILNFATYLQKLTEELFRCYNVGASGTEMVLEIEENIFFDMDTAVPLGMIVNELVSNSLKHAFPGGKTGKVQIKLSREISEKFGHSEIEDSNEARKGASYILIVSDNGVGIPESISLEDSDTLGIQLVTILVDQLDGELDLNRTSGTEFTIKIKVAENK
ncbi:PAS domain S-box protein [Methanosarcina sp.]|uniref:PAS domain S-box protein n=1 Tax=Methanosarcina sp. TaxID=2213 RepID=UPI0029897F2B|nr:PAS domain S-box protein [Methanosarcina sp.]MDW5550257.1 PAS domain S-box protein [Methanosarcina sp.]MDW5554085.1 PAS domain S-box protein [Methanosarcina sp.]MDW5560280.1 PAS domain S-box protein [Methanosarcina sp.]